MARTVDPARHRARRLQIIDAALTRFSEDGFDRATTTAICRTAGIGSGTFFHYFPTKTAVLLAVLEEGTAETEEWFAARKGSAEPARVVLEYAEHHALQCADPRVPGFVRSVGAIANDAEVAVALERDEEVIRQGLEPLIAEAAGRGQVRSDQPAERLAVWVGVLLDGYISRVAGQGRFDHPAERAMLLDAVTRLLRP
ncbi:TetR family transcriptional regulator [Kineosporia sp. NBRC 101677]|uniref:TetR/AcrR family transcriptional regulator n=1 Tax=Kineosporia sp. NBRC 101677 TaxID=3032197 RepID=UPI0024A4A810|nr:TetR/AcrR family transcriptional regulator [Kineosporia sp. NBRC 101677]GLY17443.1 TetR family transcriptional regulator [Kineosporia sp. NBRC 101677]